jgi:glycosyltransferase involved in cell wall biosynthesis
MNKQNYFELIPFAGGVFAMRIAQVSPLYESVPPLYYGGTEAVVSYLTEELVRQGHEVTLFASGDSLTSAELAACCPRSLRLDKNCVDPLPHHFVMLEELFSQQNRFDVIHYHIDYMHFPFSKRSTTPHITTLHGRLDLTDLVPLYHRFRQMPVVSISDSQRKPLPWVNWQATVHHGLPTDLLSLHERPGDYLAFLGRVSPEKRVDRAIEIAKRAGMKLKIAAKVDVADKEYFREVIKPMLAHPLVEFIGEITTSEKDEFLGNAYCLLFPIAWPEPFGLVMIEALACGVPVVAYRNGSVPEVIEDGLSGFIVDNIDDAIEAVHKVGTLSRVECRRQFDKRFTAERMAGQYLNAYSRLIAQRSLGTEDSAASSQEFERPTALVSHTPVAFSD